MKVVLLVFNLTSSDRIDFQILSSLFRAFHARAFLTAIPFSVLAVLDPRYLKSSTIFRISFDSVYKIGITSVFFPLIRSPKLPAETSTLFSNSWASSTRFERRARSSAKSRSVTDCAPIRLDCLFFKVRSSSSSLPSVA